MDNGDDMDGPQAIHSHSKKSEPIHIDEAFDYNIWIGVVSAVIVILLTLVYFVFRGSAKKGRSLLLVGLSESGKTQIYEWLILGKTVASYSSMKPQSGDFRPNDGKGKTLNVIDIPGAEKIRGKYLDDNKSKAKAVIIVIDSLNIQKEIKDVAELVYDVLTDPVLGRGIPVLLLCNKQDEPRAKSAKLIKNLLERELNTLRMTKGAALAATSGSSGRLISLGRAGKDFEFSDLSGSLVEFAECSALGQENLTEVYQWLNKLL